MNAFDSVRTTLLLVALTYTTIVRCDIGSGGVLKLVNTTTGVVRGRTVDVPLGSGYVNEFLGVPYAEPPVGHLRFARPLRKRPWSGSLDSTRKPNACWQTLDTTFGNFSGSVMWNPNTNMSEDCLYLNVWSPEPATSLPVMVWIYGGGFYSGSSALDVYDGKYMAALGGVVVVSMNYRVGAFGFLRLPGGAANVTGNAGLWDQVEALRWVQANVAAFGGDPSRVTLFGESAGAASVAYHLLSPVSRDLFQRAVLQSGSALSNWAFMTQDNAQVRYEAVLRNTGCDQAASGGSVDRSLACLLSLDARNLTDQQWFTSDSLQFPFLPTVDGELLIEPPAASVQRGSFKRCPLLIGVTSTEGGFYATYLPQLQSSFNASQVLLTITPEVMKTLIAESFSSYPIWPSKPTDSDLQSIACRYSAAESEGGGSSTGGNTSSYVRALVESMGDSRFVCGVNEWADYYAAAGQSVYYYVFNHVSKAKAWGAWTGSAHGDELDYLFGTPLRNGDYSDGDRNVSRHVMTLWSTFATTGTPNSGNTIRWPRYASDEMAYYELSLDSLKTPKIGRSFRSTYCDFYKYCLSSSSNASTKVKDNVTLCSTCKTSGGGKTSDTRSESLLLVALFCSFCALAVRSSS